MARLTGSQILLQMRAGRIVIDPFDPANITETGVDLRLGNRVAKYKAGVLDCKDPKTFEVDERELPESGFALIPGEFYLMHTLESVLALDHDPVVNGKSSVARCSIEVHRTAGFGEPGFDGQYTLEVTTMLPVVVYPGMLFCQIRFDTLEGMVSDYRTRGNYTGKDSKGPVPSKIWRQFIEKKNG